MKRLKYLVVLSLLFMGCFNYISSLDEPSACLVYGPYEQNETCMNHQSLPNGIGEEKFVYLTFDDGPSKNTEKILDILDDHGIKGTFFLIGQSLYTVPNSDYLLNRMLDTGHYIGLHSMTHDADTIYFGENSAQHFIDEMLEVQALITSITGGFESQLCRAPYGTYNNFSADHIDLVAGSNFNCWDWNIDSNDWKVSSVSELIDNIKLETENVRHSSHLVVLLHEKDITVESLPAIIDYYSQLGYTFLVYRSEEHFPLNFFNHPNF